MTAQEEHLVNHMTVKLTAHTEAETQARGAIQDMLSELGSEVVALKVLLKDLRALTGNQGLAIHQVDETLARHMLLPRHTPKDAQ